MERIMNNSSFIEGKYDTHFIENNQEELMKDNSKDECDDMVAIAAFIDFADKISRIQDNQKEFAPPAESRWKKIPYINHF